MGHRDGEHDDEDEGVDEDGGHEEQKMDDPQEQCSYNPKEDLMDYSGNRWKPSWNEKYRQKALVFTNGCVDKKPRKNIG